MGKRLFIIGTATYAALFALSLIFYMERIAFYDAAFHLFQMVKDGEPFLDQRFIKLLPQLPTLLAIKLGLSLEIVAKTYSASFVVIQYSIFVLVLKGFKSKEYAIIMLLFSVLMVTGVFYWILSEYRMGLWLCILYFAMLHRYQNTRNLWKVVLLITVGCTLLVFIAFSYLLIILPFFYFTVFLLMDGSQSKKMLSISTIAFVGVFIIRYLFFTPSYESNRMISIADYIESVGNFFKFQSTINFWDYLLTDYYMLIVLGLAATFLYVRNRSWGKLGLMLGGLIANLLIVHINISWGPEQFYIENQYLGMSLMVILPFVFDLSKILKSKHLLIIITLIVLIRIIDISLNHKIFTDRLQWLRKYMHTTEQLDNKKLIVNENRTPLDTLFMSWATPYEFWVLSTIETGETRSILIIGDPHKKDDVLNEHKSFFTPYEEIPYHELQEPYFMLNDTSQYHILDRN